MLIEVVAAAVVAGGATAAATGGPLVAARRRARRAGEDIREAHEARDAALAAAGVARAEAGAARTEARTSRETVERETRHLLEQRLPALLSHLRTPHVTVPGLLTPELAGTPVDRLHRALLDAVAEGVAAEGERVDEAGRAVVRGAMSRVHSLQLRLQDGLSEIQRRHPDAEPALMADILALDMLNELIGRAAQTPALATGSTPMLFRDDTHLVDIAVSAASRVRDFKERVGEPVNHLTRAVGVMAQSVEPLRAVLAELLANAVHFSHGTLKVDVSLHETQTGASVIVEDAGVGLNAEQFARAERLLSGAHPVRLVELGDPPQTGWAAIGALVRQYGFQVSLKKSGYGGVAAVVSVPAALLVEMPDSHAPSVHAPAPVRSREPASPPLPTGVRGVTRTAETGDPTTLPRRRRKTRERGTGPVAPVSALPRLEPREAKARWGGWQAGRDKGREAVEAVERETTEATPRPTREDDRPPQDPPHSRPSEDVRAAGSGNTPVPPTERAPHEGPRSTPRTAPAQERGHDL
ncbi:histidine kinase [Streptomyces sp. NPDC088923]|uniref:ATP-binding protein n=1 Tax=Streptomyces sp. NPDC088923 TaxID=3365913 RepID=UPI0037F751E3